MRKFYQVAFTLVFAFLALSSAPAQENFKVLSYNVLKGFQQDSLVQREYVQWVKEMDPDIIAYQEMIDFSQRELEEFAHSYNHPYAVQSKLEGFPVALSAKYPIVNVQKITDNMWHGYLYAYINAIHVFVIHFSPFDYKKRGEEIRNVLAHAATIPRKEKILIMGDFNSLSRRDAKNYQQDLVEHMRQTEKENTHIRNLKEGKIDYTVMDHMENADFQDTFWLTNTGFKHSIPTKNYGTGGFRRIDYLWANAEMAKKVLSSTIIHDYHTHHLSDHYPVLATFNIKMYEENHRKIP